MKIGVYADLKGGENMTKPNRLLTPDDLADVLQIARKTVIVMAREKRIPCVRVGRFVRFDPAEIARWLDNQRH